MSHLFNLSLQTSTVPSQWKCAQITPIPKTKNPSTPSDYRPISVTSIISRQLEQHVVKNYLYPALNDPPEELNFHDQFAFRPSGSTSAALIAILQTISDMMLINENVILISLDFSKAFDCVKHDVLFEKIAKLNVQDNIYNWLKSYFYNRQHSTKFEEKISNIRAINASVVQGSGLGPVSYSIAASDLKPKNKNFKIHKFADDTYLVTTGNYTKQIKEEIEHVANWASNNNLILNSSKTREMVIHKRHSRNHSLIEPTLGVERVDSLVVLGVTLQNNQLMDKHVSKLLTECGGLLYAMHKLRAHGMQTTALQEVFRAKILAKIVYASPSWWGYASSEDCRGINSFLNKAKRFGFYPPSAPSFEDICSAADEKLFIKIASNTCHVLYQFLPNTKTHEHFLRTRRHNFNLPENNKKNFLSRILYKDIY